MKKILMSILAVAMVSILMFAFSGCKEAAEEVVGAAEEVEEVGEEVTEEAIEAAEEVAEELGIDLRKYEGTEITLLGHPTHHIEGIIQFADVFTELTGITVNVDLYDEPTQKSKQTLDYSSGNGDYDASLVPFIIDRESVY